MADSVDGCAVRGQCISPDALQFGATKRTYQRLKKDGRSRKTKSALQTTQGHQQWGKDAMHTVWWKILGAVHIQTGASTRAFMFQQCCAHLLQSAQPAQHGLDPREACR